MTGVFATDVLYELDVTEDLVAWASGEPNYGWAFLPTGGDGNGITSFESVTDPVPTLTVSGISTSGDFNADLEDVRRFCRFTTGWFSPPQRTG